MLNFNDKQSALYRLKGTQHIKKDLELLAIKRPNHHLLKVTYNSFTAENVNEKIIWELLEVATEAEISANRAQVSKTCEVSSDEIKKVWENATELNAEPEKKSGSKSRPK
jgi:hypothetical protein